jgi:butyrate kinase
MDLIDLAFAGKFDKKQLQGRLVGQGGLAAHLGTTDVQQVEEKIKGGDEKARLVLAAMAYQIAKDIGAMAVVLNGRIDGIILTGGIAHSEMLTGHIEAQVRFLAPVAVYPGEDEMAALAAGGMRVLEKEEVIMKY